MTFLNSLIIVKASRGAGEPNKLNFKEAFTNVKGAIKAVMAEFNNLDVEEGEGDRKIR